MFLWQSGVPYSACIWQTCLRSQWCSFLRLQGLMWKRLIFLHSVIGGLGFHQRRSQKRVMKLNFCSGGDRVGIPFPVPFITYNWNSRTNIKGFLKVERRRQRILRPKEDLYGDKFPGIWLGIKEARNLEVSRVQTFVHPPSILATPPQLPKSSLTPFCSLWL